VITSDVGYENIKSHVKRDLKGLKVAPYYGCQIVRPNVGFDHPEYPKSLDNLIISLGGDAISFPLKARCCGGSLILSEEEAALDLLYKLFSSAATNGAQCIVTVCPLCQTNLDVYQNKINRKYKTNFAIPILFFTQLMGVAFAVDSKQLELGKCIVSADKAMAGFLTK
jgi:heterodisulfide reductase subunit B